MLLQLFVLYYGLAAYIHLGPVQAAVLGLGLNYAAYEAEVYRGALLAIPRGQTEAAQGARHGAVADAAATCCCRRRCGSRCRR